MKIGDIITAEVKNKLEALKKKLEKNEQKKAT